MILTRVILLKCLLLTGAQAASSSMRPDPEMCKRWMEILQTNQELMSRVKLWNVRDLDTIPRHDRGETSTEIYKRMADNDNFDCFPDPFQHDTQQFVDIDKDVERIGNTTDRFLECRQVLISFAIFDTETKYAQGMADIVAVFLRIGMTAENALKCFVGFIDRMCIRGCFLAKWSDTWEGIMAKTHVLALLLPHSSQWGATLEVHETKSKRRRAQANYLEVLNDVMGSGPAGLGNYGFFSGFGASESKEQDGVVMLWDYMISNNSYKKHPAMVIFAVKIAMLDQIVMRVKTARDGDIADLKKYDEDKACLISQYDEDKACLLREMNGSEHEEHYRSALEHRTKELKTRLDDMDADILPAQTRLIFEEDVKLFRKGYPASNFTAGRWERFLLKEVTDSSKHMTTEYATNIITMCEWKSYKQLSNNLTKVQRKTHLVPTKNPDKFPGHCGKPLASLPRLSS